MPFRSQAQRAFLYANHPSIAKRWTKEFPNQGKLPYHVAKKKLGVKKKTKPGDLLKAYKKKVNNSSKYYGEVDDKKKTAFINKKLSKSHPTHKRPAKKGASKYPEIKDSAYHERLHMLHPHMTEKEVYKRTHKAMKTISKKESKKLYSLFK